MVHRTVEQLKQEGLVLPFEQIVSACVFAGNALISVNGSTPYNAVYGRVPAMLPDLNTSIDDAAPGTGRHVMRLRE
eukprot:7877243-Alexandrium_andersonii.AAC.1